MTDLPDPARGTFSAEEVGDELLITVVGELDESTAGAVIGLADNPLNTSRRITLDLAGVTYMDSSGVFALVRLRDHLLGLKLRNPAPSVANVLHLAGLDVWLVPPE
jgi:anti-anti-sigma factor